MYFSHPARANVFHSQIAGAELWSVPSLNRDENELSALSAQILASRGLDKDDPKRASVGQLQAAKTLSSNIRNRRGKYLEEIKDDNGQFQGKYRDQMSVVDSRKNESIKNTSASTGQIVIHYSNPVGMILFYNFDNANSQIMSGEEIKTFKRWLEADEDRQIVISYSRLF